MARPGSAHSQRRGGPSDEARPARECKYGAHCRHPRTCKFLHRDDEQQAISSHPKYADFLQAEENLGVQLKLCTDKWAELKGESNARLKKDLASQLALQVMQLNIEALAMSAAAHECTSRPWWLPLVRPDAGAGLLSNEHVRARSVGAEPEPMASPKPLARGTSAVVAPEAKVPSFESANPYSPLEQNGFAGTCKDLNNFKYMYPSFRGRLWVRSYESSQQPRMSYVVPEDDQKLSAIYPGFTEITI